MFFQFRHHAYFTDGPKMNGPVTTKTKTHARSSLKTKYVAWTQEPNIGPTYMVLLQEIAN